jgi:hypothetical protein
LVVVLTLPRATGPAPAVVDVEITACADHAHAVRYQAQEHEAQETAPEHHPDQQT